MPATQMVSVILASVVGIYKVFVVQQSQSTPVSLESRCALQNPWYSTQVHCECLRGCGGDELRTELPFLLFLAKPHSLPAEVLVKWELEVMHIRV